MEAIRYKPNAFFRLDDTTPIQDYSGYDSPATTTGTISKGIALTADAFYSIVLDTDSTFSASAISDVYEKGKEAHPWSISAVVVPTTAGQNQILSKAAVYDGLSVNGTVISFGTRYTTTGTAYCSYDIGFLKKVNLVGVHTESKNSLFVNGELVAEIDITPEQQLDGYAAGGKTFNSGSGTGVFLANNFGFFPRALRTEEIQGMYLADQRRPEGYAGQMFDGEVIETGTNMRPPYLDTGWYTDDDWNQGQLYKVESENGVLYASKIDDLSLAGIWSDSVSVFQGETPVGINSINLWWEGENVLVEVSKDSTTWSSVTRGLKISSYTADQVPTSDSLFVRVTFTAGVENAWIKNLRVNGFTTSTITYSPDRTITYPSTAVTFDDDIPPGDLRDDWGVNLRGGLWSITNTVSTDYPKTVEIWWKRTAAVTLSSNLSGAGTIYTNGIAGTGDRADEWVLKHYTKSTGFSGLISISGNVTVGKVVFYPNVLTATDIGNLIEEYTGFDKVSTSDGIISIAESPTAWQSYGHDWEIQQA